MIKLITVEDMIRIEHLPMEVKEQIKIHLEILDEAYGSNRTELDLGGFVAVIEEKQDLMVLKEVNYLDIEEDTPEWITNIGIQGGNWKVALYCLSTDWNLIILGEESKVRFLEEE